MWAAITYLYNHFADAPFLSLLVILTVAVLIYLKNKNFIPDQLLSLFDLGSIMDGVFYGASEAPRAKKRNSVIWSRIWLILQVLAVLCTIVGFGIQIGIYFSLLPERL